MDWEFTRASLDAFASQTSLTECHWCYDGLNGSRLGTLVRQLSFGSWRLRKSRHQWEEKFAGKFVRIMER